MNRELPGDINKKENNIKIRQSKIHIKRYHRDPIAHPAIILTGEKWKHRDLWATVCSNVMYNSQKRETAQCPATGKWINKLWYVHTMEYYSAIQRDKLQINAPTWLNLRNTKMNERSRTQKATYGMIPFMWHSRNASLEKSDQWLPGTRGKKGGRVYKERVRENMGGDAASIFWLWSSLHNYVFVKTQQIVHLKG